MTQKLGGLDVFAEVLDPELALTVGSTQSPVTPVTGQSASSSLHSYHLHVMYIHTLGHTHLHIQF